MILLRILKRDLSWKIDRLILSKIGSINIKKSLKIKDFWDTQIEDLRLHRGLPESAKIKTCTIERDLDRWYACFGVEVEIEDPDQNKEITLANSIGSVDYSDRLKVRTSMLM